MRIGILSDTHGHLGALERALEVLGPCDRYWHCGDILGYGQEGIRVAEIFRGLGCFIPVRGNCDRQADADILDLELPLERILPLDGHLVYLCHGHCFGAEGSVDIARSEHCTLLVSGHTHIKRLEKRRNFLLLNPGSPAEPRDGIPSVARYEDGVFELLDVRDGSVLRRQVWPTAADEGY